MRSLDARPKETHMLDASSDPETSVHRPPAEADTDPGPGLVVEELLVEEVSIDGMCGVY
ncbi:MAG: mycofactocin precursor MftA [Actinomycetota bacterium]|nr:mycofactocin precursor MftA [Actinomycetota bacterium]